MCVCKAPRQLISEWGEARGGLVHVKLHAHAVWQLANTN